MKDPAFALSDETINAMPPDEFADRLIASLETQGPLLSLEDMDRIEAAWETLRVGRRMMLATLTKPWSWLGQRVIEDREFALMVAEVRQQDITLYTKMLELAQAANAWGLVALAGREDMAEILGEAKPQKPGRN